MFQTEGIRCRELVTWMLEGPKGALRHPALRAAGSSFCAHSWRNTNGEVGLPGPRSRGEAPLAGLAGLVVGVPRELRLE